MKRVFKILAKYLFLLETGGGVYILIEILYRGHSHWTMFILGALSFVLVGLLNEFFSWKTPIELQMLIGGGTITLLELIMGLIVNIKLHWNIWDYSDVPMNFMGQICLSFSIMWILMSGLIILADDYIRYWLFHEDKPIYRSILTGQ